MSASRVGQVITGSWADAEYETDFKDALKFWMQQTLISKKIKVKQKRKTKALMRRETKEINEHSAKEAMEIIDASVGESLHVARNNAFAWWMQIKTINTHVKPMRSIFDGPACDSRSSAIGRSPSG